MELKNTLNKPYTEAQRLDFIVTNNHQQGFEIKETDTALEAWGKTEEEKSAEAKQAQRAELIAQLDALDLKAIRSMRAIQSGKSTEDDAAYLQQLEQQAAQLRAQLKNL